MKIEYIPMKGTAGVVPVETVARLLAKLAAISDSKFVPYELKQLLRDTKIVPEEAP